MKTTFSVKTVGHCCTLSASAVHKSFCIVLSSTWVHCRQSCIQPWQPGHQVLQADDCGRNVSLQAAFIVLDFLLCIIKPVLVFPARKAHFSIMVLIRFRCSSGSAAVTQCKSLLQQDLKMMLSLGSRSLHLQLLHLGTFSLGRRPEGKETMKWVFFSNLSFIISPFFLSFFLSFFSFESAMSMLLFHRHIRALQVFFTIHHLCTSLWSVQQSALGITLGCSMSLVSSWRVKM